MSESYWTAGDGGGPYDRFMESYVAALELRNRAGENGFFIEAICLATSIIDAQLRIGLVLQHQLRTETSQIPSSLIHEPDEMRGMSEKQVYKKALQEGVIDEGLCKKLRELYYRRNKVVHRFVVSEITTPQVLDIGIEYERLRQRFPPLLRGWRSYRLREV